MRALPSARRMARQTVRLPIPCDGSRISFLAWPVLAWLPSDLTLASVSEELDAVDEAGLVRSQKSRGGSDLVRFGNAAERNMGGDCVEGSLVAVGSDPAEQARRPGRAGAQDVDADGTPGEVDGPAAGEAADRGLCGAVDALPGCDPHRGGGAGEDDRRLLAEERQRLLHGEDDALDVRGEHGVHLLLGDVAEYRADTAAGIRHQDVDAAPAFPHGPVQHVEVSQAGRVGADGLDLSVDPGYGGVQGTLPAAGDEHVRAVRREPAGDCESDAGGSTGNDGRFVMKPAAHERSWRNGNPRGKAVVRLFLTVPPKT